MSRFEWTDKREIVKKEVGEGTRIDDKKDTGIRRYSEIAIKFGKRIVERHFKHWGQRTGICEDSYWI